jgi:hypothetical protein
MASFSWAAPVSGDWGTAARWTPAQVPNDALADVTIDNPTLAAYLVTISTGENANVHSLSMNAVNNLQGSNQAPYKAAELEINGTLTFGAGSPGNLSGSLQTFVSMINGTMINPGTIDAFIQTEGNVLLTGTNGFYVTNWLQSLGAITTIDVKSIAEMTGNTLFDGIYEAKGDGSIINLGGPRQNMIVNIATIEGPPLIPDGWTELILNGRINDIGEWNGTGYVPIESTLTQIANRGTFDVIGGRDYNTTNTLSIAAGGLLNLQAGTVTTGLLNINGGTVQGAGNINSGVINNGTLRALDGLLTVGAGGLVGTGLVTFDFDQKFGTVAATGSTMEVHGVGPGQTFVMNGDDTLVIDTPGSFAGTIQAKAGDQFFLGGVRATGATLVGQTLVLQNGATNVGSLNLGGSYAGDTFAVSAFGPTSTQVKINRAAAATTAASTDDGNTVGKVYTVDAAHITPDALNISGAGPDAFIQAAGGGGSNFVTAGGGAESFQINVRDANSSSLSTIANFHSGDDVTIWGVSLSDFSVSLANNVGAPGSTGLALTFTEAGHPSVGVVLSGYSIADLVNGRLSQTLGSTGGSGSPYLTIHAT